MNDLIKMMSSFNSSISYMNKSLFEEQSLYLLFIYIDQLGWINTPKEFSNGQDFKNWLDTYCDLTDARCTSEDLWNARCSYLHMGTAENMRFDSLKNYRLGFYQNKKYSEKELNNEESKYPKPTKLVDINVLFECINVGISNFLKAIENNRNLEINVIRKINQRNIYFRQI